MKVRILLVGGRGGVYQVDSDQATETDTRLDRSPPLIRSLDEKAIASLKPGDKVWTDSLGFQVSMEIQEIEVIPEGSSNQ